MRGVCFASPGNPASVGPASRLANSEEQAYLEKWKQLQKYVEPLKRMINKIDKDEGACLCETAPFTKVMLCLCSVTGIVLVAV